MDLAKQCDYLLFGNNDDYDDIDVLLLTSTSSSYTSITSASATITDNIPNKSIITTTRISIISILSTLLQSLIKDGE